MSQIAEVTLTHDCERLEDLRIPPGNQLHPLKGTLSGFHAIRVNDQYRILFRFVGTDAFDVRCTDYH